MALVLAVVMMIGFAGLYVSAIVSASRVEAFAWRGAGRSKNTTVALIVFTGGIAGLYYWVRLRPQLRAAR